MFWGRSARGQRKGLVGSCQCVEPVTAAFACEAAVYTWPGGPQRSRVISISCERTRGPCSWSSEGRAWPGAERRQSARGTEYLGAHPHPHWEQRRTRPWFPSPATFPVTRTVARWATETRSGACGREVEEKSQQEKRCTRGPQRNWSNLSWNGEAGPARLAANKNQMTQRK